MKTTQKHPSAELTETYRAFPANRIDVQGQALSTFLAHGRAFDELGWSELVPATRRAWLGDAVLLAMVPTRTADEARNKIEHLSMVDAVIVAAGSDGHRSASIIVATAIAAERQRWQLEPAQQH